MLSLCFYHQKARKSWQNRFRDKTAYFWALDYRWWSFAIDDRRSRGRATYAGLALFELESSSVTSVWSQQTLWETDRQPDPKIGPQNPGCDENGKVCVGEATPTSRILQAQSFFFLFCCFSVTLRPQGWIKVRLTVLFRTDSFRTQTDLQTVSEMFICDRQFWTKQMQKIMMAWY